MNLQDSVYKYCLRLGDNALILSYRLSEWCSKAPSLEEDLALTNLALDLTGRAQALLTYAAVLEGKQRTADDLAYRRGEREFVNSLIMELPNGDFAFTIARQLFVSAFESYYFTGLKNSADEMLAGIAAKTLKEVKYHLAHATDWAIRLGDGTTESHRRMQHAVNSLWMYTAEQFEMDSNDELLCRQGIAVDTAMLRQPWLEHINRVLKEAKINPMADGYAQTGGHKGIHTEHLGHILAEMQYLQRAYPDATW